MMTSLITAVLVSSCALRLLLSTRVAFVKARRYYSLGPSAHPYARFLSLLLSFSATTFVPLNVSPTSIMSSFAFPDGAAGLVDDKRNFDDWEGLTTDQITAVKYALTDYVLICVVPEVLLFKCLKQVIECGRYRFGAELVPDGRPGHYLPARRRARGCSGPRLGHYARCPHAG